jgi:serine phosphatase RsbU (regulator of sigma subunit)
MNQTEIISKIGQKITSSLNLSEVIDLLYESIKEMMDATGFIIYILDESGNQLEAKYILGKHKDIVHTNIPMTDEGSFCVYTIKNEASLFINDVKVEYVKYLNDYYWKDIADDEIIHSFINIPLVMGKRVFGVISVQSFNRNAYTQDDFSILKALASFMSIAFNNAETFEQLNKAKENISIQKREIEHKQKEIIDSINYASRIQRAMLTSEEYISKHLYAEYFIFYQPKDIVSGDFYWAASTGSDTNNKFYIATADCTGHGVPGAFMSLLNINFLNENLLERGIKDPASILNEQRKEIIKALNPTGTENSKDGMDCVLCSFDIEGNKLEFAASNNPVWIIRNDEVLVFKADKMPVGKGENNERSFTLQSVQLEKGDVVYTFTDGYADQFGGERGKKFMYKQLQQLLLANHKFSMKDQKEILASTINNWIGDEEQVDDMLIIGVRIK